MYFGDTFSDIKGRLDKELNRITAFIAMQKTQLSAVKANPLNYILETQRDAMTRAENAIAQNERILQQLKDTQNAAVVDAATGNNTRLNSWVKLAAIIGDASDLKIWSENLGYASTANMITTVAEDTAEDVADKVKNPFGVPIWAWLVGAGSLAIIANAAFRNRRR